MESPSTGETPAALPRLCRPVALRGTTLRNPIVISPMCQYSAVNGEAGDWHRVHLGRFAMGGAGMVMVEATAVTEQGRITPGDLGLWDDRQIPGLRGIAGTLKGLGAVPGIQLGHAGRKAATQRPWQHGPLTATDAARGEPPWPVIAPSPLPVADGWPVPAELDRAGIAALVEAWRTAAARALEAGFEAVELHCAHGYLLHQFLSPLSNRRTDGYGGDPAGRCRFPLEVAAAVRAVWPVERPMFVRISATDWIEGGWTIEDSVAFSRDLRDLGIDVIDCSSGGMTGVSATAAAVPRHPG
ncbi:NADH:flavin oxidoreductase/NADH oxidase, partial [Azospirillum brasilense]|uniref:NADH:flavin oxidoreductase/NADH oxidase n=1 Tax=Azospirillum brasilense TaxID=192 RepID=UPI000554C6D7